MMICRLLVDKSENYTVSKNGEICEVNSILKVNAERGSSVVECRTLHQVSPGSNPPLLPFRRFGIFVLSIDAPVDSAV